MNSKTWLRLILVIGTMLVSSSVTVDWHCSCVISQLIS